MKYKTQKNKIPELAASLKSLNDKKIVVGSRNPWLAGIHEYGLKIEITPDMRNWLHANGLHVKDSTTHITIPERAFLRNGFDENIDRIKTQIRRVLPIVLSGKMPVDAMLDKYGDMLATAIKEYMGKTQPNHPFTIERKGSSTPLSDSGDLVESIQYEIEG